MDLIEAIHERRSIRAFRPDPVPRDVLHEILEASLRAPSWGNTQPWKLTVIGGEKLRRLSLEFCAQAEAGEPPRTDLDFPGNWPEALSRRYKENGKRLFAALGIGREDKEKRTALRMEMFRFFGAPQAIYIHVDAGLGPYPVFDAGLLAQNITLLAVAKGLGTCFLAVSVHFADVVRRHTGIPATDRIVIGMAIGYPEEEAPANQFRSAREPLESFARWVE